MTIRVQNVGKRKIQFGTKPHEVLVPGKYAILNDDVAKKHIKMFPHEIIDIDNAANSIDQTKIEDLTKEPEKAETKEAEKTPEKKTDSGNLAAALKASAGLKTAKK